jgi:hypothetical protein
LKGGILIFICNCIDFILETVFHIIFVDPYWRQDLLIQIVVRWFFYEVVDSFVWLFWNNPRHQVGKRLWKNFNTFRGKTKYAKFYDWAKNYYFEFIVPRLRGVIILFIIVLYFFTIVIFICFLTYWFLVIISLFWPENFHLDKVFFIRDWWAEKYSFIMHNVRFLFSSLRLFKGYWRIFFEYFYNLREKCFKVVLQTELIQRLLRVELLQRLYTWIYFNLYIEYYKPFRRVFFPHLSFPLIYLCIKTIMYLLHWLVLKIY